MIQYVLLATIGLLVVLYTVRELWRLLFAPRGEASGGCEGCNGCGLKPEKKR